METLSDQEVEFDYCPLCNLEIGFKGLPSETVKSFIKQLKGMIEFELKPVRLGKAISDRLNSQINKLAGDKLT